MGSFTKILLKQAFVRIPGTNLEINMKLRTLLVV